MNLQRFLQLLSEGKSEYFKYETDDEKKKYLLNILKKAGSVNDAVNISGMRKETIYKKAGYHGLEKEVEELKRKGKQKSKKCISNKSGLCPHCGKEYKDLSNHIRNAHECRFCNPYSYHKNFEDLKQHIKVEHPDKFEEWSGTSNNLRAYQTNNKEKGLKQSNQFTKWGELEIPIYLRQHPNVKNITELELRKIVNKGEYTPTYKMPHGSLYQQFGELNPFFGKSHKEGSINKIKGTVRRLIEEGNWHNWIGRNGRSFAEQYFYDIFDKMTDKPINNRYEIGYWMDFAWENGKVYIEVDGEQHYTPEGEAHDKIRTEKLAADGWTLVRRVRWSDYKKMSPEEQEKYVKKLLKEVEEKSRCRFEELGNVELIKTGEETFGLNK